MSTDDTLHGAQQNGAAGADAAGRADRVLRLAALLRGADGPQTAEAIAGALDVSVRTVYRDIETLRANGYDIDGAPGRGYRLVSEPTGPNSAPAAPRAAPAAIEAPAPTAFTPGRLPPPSSLRAAIRARHRADEEEIAAALAGELRTTPETEAAIFERARGLVAHMRENRRNEGGIDRFMHEYALSSEEGVALMCLAEALLRIPDAATADALIEDKIGGANWREHLGKADSLFVNASTLGLMVSGKVLKLGAGDGLGSVLGRLIHRSGEPVIRTAVRQAMRILGRQFVMGRTIDEAITRLKSEGGARASFDMLGEAARTDADARRYHAAYLGAIAAVAAAGKKGDAPQDPTHAHGVSIKLSALHARYEFAQSGRPREILYERLLEAAEAAAAANIQLCIDAEEEERLEPSLDLIARLAHEPSLAGWDGLGLALQAYQKRARPLIDWVVDLARTSGRRLAPRLVKGAYWDTEIKRAQVLGYADFPVFTRKAHTDVSYLACARALLAAGGALHPCFATHNAQTVAAILGYAGGRDPNGAESWEFQRLHGMGAPLFDGLAAALGDATPPTRIYAPVGGHEDLLAYLVRRLLENGANSSFVNRIVDDAAPLEELAESPVTAAARGGFQRHPAVARPAELFAPRKNSAGYDLFAPDAVTALADAVSTLERDAEPMKAGPMLAGAPSGAGAAREIRSPADRSRLVGRAEDADPALLDAAVDRAAKAQTDWDAIGAEARAAVLERAADLYEQEGPRLMRLAVREAGKSWPDAVAELREAVDFLRFYAAEARRLFANEEVLPGPTGEENTLRLHGSGVWLCISPWNFPLAIFTGQVAAALAAGNAVIAKPAEQTPLIAFAAVELLRRAGAPEAALQLAPGDGPTVAGPMIRHPKLSGVAFTGSTETARLIQRQLAERDGPITPLLAETGGLNAMIVDSSALPEQVTRDVLIGAFQSAGQRCSALRVLYLQDECYDRQIEMIMGAMQELTIGDPALLATDVGPVIDADAQEAIDRHVAKLRAEDRILAQTPRPNGLPEGYWATPTLARIDDIGALEREVFGPVLHVVRWKAAELDAVVDRINATGYGLTLGVHSRVTAMRRRVARRARVGNVYVNRNQIGAIVGSQPFGGEGLSGTGPKAGGPHTLLRFAVERAVSVDLTAEGGDARLMAIDA